MPDNFNTETVMFGHTDEATAFVVDDYPYGFRLRTSIRYWIETTKNGDRFCSQTLNPKTNRWNKPKKSTYVEVGVLFTDEAGHVTHTGITSYADDTWIEEFRSVVGENLSPAQRSKLAAVIAIKRVMSKVTWTVGEGRMTDEELNEQARLAGLINRAIATETDTVRQELA